MFNTLWKNMGIRHWFKRKDAQQASPSSQSQQRLEDGLNRTRHRLWDRWSRDSTQTHRDEQLTHWKTALLSADVGPALTDRIISNLKTQLPQYPAPDQTIICLKNLLYAHLEQYEKPQIEQSASTVCSILIVGINGAGKTTTIGKLAHYFTQQGASVLLAAGDTYRAAAIEQLKIWGQRQSIPVIAQTQGADSASVIFDALQAAQARNIDVLLADTAGRLHTQHNLMQELTKIKRVMHKADSTAPHETWLVLDGTLGQNSLTQAQEFHETLNLTGLIMTKLDGSAQGGSLLAITEHLNLPIRFIGVGEQTEDLQVFNSRRFIDALLTAPP